LADGIADSIVDASRPAQEGTSYTWSGRFEERQKGRANRGPPEQEPSRG
jgi:hypothetical protein